MSPLSTHYPDSEPTSIFSFSLMQRPTPTTIGKAQHEIIWGFFCCLKKNPNNLMLIFADCTSYAYISQMPFLNHPFKTHSDGTIFKWCHVMLTVITVHAFFVELAAVNENRNIFKFSKCLSPLQLCFRTLCDKVCQWLSTGRWLVLWFPPPIKLTATI